MPKACNFTKKRLWQRCFPMNFTEHIRVTVSANKYKLKKFYRQKKRCYALCYNSKWKHSC